MSTATDLAKQLERIIESSDTKANKARALMDLGCDRSDVVALLDMSYSQAHSIWKKRHEPSVPGRDASDASGSDSPSARQLHRSSKRSVRDAERSSPLNGLQMDNSGPLGARPLFLSPTQTRYATQDGHVIVRVDKTTGPECRHCGRRLTFTIKWLAFVHTDSSADPTALEDIYYDPGSPVSAPGA